MLLAAYITSDTFLAPHFYEIEVIMLVVMLSLFWCMVSFRLVNAFGGAPFLEGSPCRIICSEGMIIT
jgi:hypothetical protein